MSAPVLLSDRAQLAHYLRRFPDVNYYHLGDLDDFFWPRTRWYGRLKGEAIASLALFYTAADPPVLLAILNENEAEMTALLNDLLPQLPPHLYAHLSPGLDSLFAPHYRLTHHGEHYKMALKERSALAGIPTGAAEPLSPKHETELLELYETAYPGNWFDPRMLETGLYVGIRGQDGELLCVAGVHVYSRQYRVAAVGNIATRPEVRGRGLACVALAALCKRLLYSVDTIGLNVRIDNTPAIRAYTRLGFAVTATYHEWMMVSDAGQIGGSET